MDCRFMNTDYEQPKFKLVRELTEIRVICCDGITLADLEN
ncbi:MAG: hypothetical protein ACI9FU_001843 [Granulosicoccus sp.]|jgi:hypothetical protein